MNHARWQVKGCCSSALIRVLQHPSCWHLSASCIKACCVIFRPRPDDVGGPCVRVCTYRSEPLRWQGVEEKAERLARVREGADDTSVNQESLADLFASFLVETGAAFNAWADAAHITGPQEHDVYKCALALIHVGNHG